MITRIERDHLRELAKRVRDIAALDVQKERRARWKKHNALQATRPLVLIFPEGGWRELLPDDSLCCESEWARSAERDLRQRIYIHEKFISDYVIESHFNVSKCIGDTGWGLATEHTYSEASAGAWGFSPVMVNLSDSEKLQHPQLLYDEKKSLGDYELAADTFGDVLTVRQQGRTHISCHLAALVSGWRGLDQLCLDMIDEPKWVHQLIRFVTDGVLGLQTQAEEMGLIDSNHEDDYHSSGGIGYTDELSAVDASKPRLCDLWGSAESQEMTMVSPDMHWEFFMQYEREFLEPMGLNGYGCCDDLTRKLNYVCALPKMRRISISPFADVAASAEQLQGNFILSWKPPPQDLVGHFNPERVRTHLREALDAAARHGCVLEIILKDTHTCEQHPERFTEWSQIAREEVERETACG